MVAKSAPAHPHGHLVRSARPVPRRPPRPPRHGGRGIAREGSHPRRPRPSRCATADRFAPALHVRVLARILTPTSGEPKIVPGEAARQSRNSFPEPPDSPAPPWPLKRPQRSGRCKPDANECYTGSRPRFCKWNEPYRLPFSPVLSEEYTPISNSGHRQRTTDNGQLTTNN